MYSCRPYGTLALLWVNPALRYAACWARLFRPAGSRLRPFGLDHQPFGLGLMRPAEQCEGMKSHPLANNGRAGWGTRRLVEPCGRDEIPPSRQQRASRMGHPATCGAMRRDEIHPLAKNGRAGWGTRRPVEQCERMKSHPLAKIGRAGWGTRHTNPAFHRRTKPGCPTHSRFSNEWETAKRTTPNSPAAHPREGIHTPVAVRLLR